MSASDLTSQAREFYEKLRRRVDLSGFSDGALADAALNRVKGKGSTDSAGEEEVATQLRMGAEKASMGGGSDVLGAIVSRQFEGATQDIASRHLEAVRHERTRRLIAGILEALGGPGANLVDVLHGAGRAVTDAVTAGAGGIPWTELEKRLAALGAATGDREESRKVLESWLRARAVAVPLDAAATAQLAHAVSQAVQQVAVNVQKIVTVALDAERSGDAENPRYSSP